MAVRLRFGLAPRKLESLKLHHQLNIYNVLITRNHLGLFKEGSIPADAYLKTAALLDIDYRAGPNRIRPPPVETGRSGDAFLFLTGSDNRSAYFPEPL